MPTYDYKCSKCGQSFEIFHSMSEPARTICPNCKEPALQRMIGEGSGIIFKGHGFYETDFKHDSSCACGCGKSHSGSCPHKS
ncbi:MAG: FmdB family zinc ribbon protein [bacterium]